MIRDQDLLNPDAPPAKSEPVISKNLLDSDGDAANTGTGFGKPSKDLSVNFVPVPYPDYPPATLTMKPGERQLWRVLNASAITYLNLALLVRSVPQPLGIVAHRWRADPLPGQPVAAGAMGQPHRRAAGRPRRVHRRRSAAGRAGAAGDARGRHRPGRRERSQSRAASRSRPRPTRPIRKPTLPAHAEPLPPPSRPWLGNVAPVRVRKLFFSEQPENPNDPNSPTKFFLTYRRRNAEAVRSAIGRARYRREARRRRGLDHREPLDGAARFPHPPAALPVASNGPALPSTSRSCAIP